MILQVLNKVRNINSNLLDRFSLRAKRSHIKSKRDNLSIQPQNDPPSRLENIREFMRNRHFSAYATTCILNAKVPLSLSRLFYIDSHFIIFHAYMYRVFCHKFCLLLLINGLLTCLRGPQGRLVLPIGSPSVNKVYLLTYFNGNKNKNK